jgi:transcriptional regulator with XRE-family HTH domain
MGLDFRSNALDLGPEVFKHSRVENGHTVPSVATLEKIARALEVPLYKLFYDGEEPPNLENLPKRISTKDLLWGSGKEARILKSFLKTAQRLRESDRNLLLFLARRMASKRRGAATA